MDEGCVQCDGQLDFPVWGLFLEQPYGTGRPVSLAVLIMSWRKAATGPNLPCLQHLGKPLPSGNLAALLGPPLSLTSSSPAK